MHGFIGVENPPIFIGMIEIGFISQLQNGTWPICGTRSWRAVMVSTQLPMSIASGATRNAALKLLIRQ